MQRKRSLFSCVRPILALFFAWQTGDSATAQTASQAIEIESPSTAIVAPTRFAWCCELSPDESWLVACYGFFQGDIGRIRVWDLKTGKTKWEALERRGVRRVAISPDGSLIASGNYGGEIHLRDAATGELQRSFDNGGGSVECVSFSSNGRTLVSCGNRRVLRLCDVATGQLLKTMEGHTDAVYGVRFSPDDKLLVSYGRDGSVRIWNADDGDTLRVFRHPDQVHAAIFLPDAKHVATACEDGQIRIYRLDGDDVVATLPPLSAQRGRASALATSTDGTLLAAGVGTQIRMFSTSDWKPAATFDELRSFTWGLHFSRDDKTLFSAGTDSSIRTWDVVTRTEKQRFSVPPSEPTGAGPVRALAISPDGKLIATAAGGRGVEVRDRASGELSRTLPTRDATSIAFSPDGQTLAAGGGLSFWDVSSGTLRHDAASAVIAVTWSPDGKLYAIGGSDNVVRVWDKNTKEQIAALEGHSEQVVAITFSPDGKRLLSASSDATARVWDWEKKSAIATLKGHTAAINAVAYSADGKTIATASNDGTVKLWYVAGYQPRTSYSLQQPLVSIAFASDGNTLAVGGEQGAIWTVNWSRGGQQRRLVEHYGAVRGLAFLPDNSGLISASEDESIRFWKAAEQAISPLVLLSAHSPEALCVAFSADGKSLVTGGADKNIAIRDAVSGIARRSLRGHTGRVNRIAISPDSKQLASVSADGTARLWSIEGGDEVWSLSAWREKFAAGRSVAFSSDGRTVASGADDGTIKLWDASDGKELRVLAEQSLPVTSLAFASGGSLLASATGDWRNNRVPGELRLWDVASGQAVAELRGCASEIKCIAIDPNGKWLASTEANSDLRLWDLTDRRLQKTVRLESLSGSLAFSPDGQRLATGHYSGGITLWSIPEMTPIQRYAGHTKGIPGIAFSADGKFIATTSTDGKLGIWPVQ
jgi:WD40 repeat protein